MKLRNKQTGEIGSLKPYGEDVEIQVWIDNMSKPEYRYNSLAELSTEWEDYEEQKEYWYICEQAEPIKIRNNPKDIPNFVGRCLSIGNIFETKEEAEKAVEKLKALTKLKNCGLRFEAYNVDTSKPGWYNVAKSGACENLTKPYILERIDEIFEAHGLNDQFVDKQLEKLIVQDADFNTKMKAIAEYNKLKSRITEKKDITSGGEKIDMPVALVEFVDGEKDG